MLFVTIPRSVFGAIKKRLQVILHELLNAFGWMHVYIIELIMLTTKMMWVLLTHEVEKTSGIVRYYNKKVVG